jgi:hypothetical protein
MSFRSMNISPLFFELDGFCRCFEPIGKKHLLAQNRKKRHRARSLASSQVLTLLILFHKPLSGVGSREEEATKSLKREKVRVVDTFSLHCTL